MRQLSLAKDVGISAAYLNLIEHNRRRIGGKLLLNIAAMLEVDASVLTEGAEVALLETLSQAAVSPFGQGAEVDRVEDFAGRFPGWAKLAAGQHTHIEALEQTVVAMTDRLTHDPQLAASLHEVLSVVTAIRSTSAILADDGEIKKEWRARFHRNLYEDSQRLAASSQALVSYLDATGEGESDMRMTLPQEDLERWLEARDYHIGELEISETLDPADFLKTQSELTRTRTSTLLAQKYFEKYVRDAVALPSEPLIKWVAENGISPTLIARQFGIDLATVFRRLTTLPDIAGQAVGLVICDSSGTLTFRKKIEGFPMPRFGAACPLWPLYQSLSRPMSPLQAVVEQAGHRQQRYLTYAISLPLTGGSFSTGPVFEATMLILPESERVENSELGVTYVGPNCRICPRLVCDARRESSILTEGF